VPIYFGRILTGKESIAANVFLDADVVHAIAELLDLHKDAEDGERVFPHREDFLSIVLRNLAISAKVNMGEKEVSFHALRRFLYDRLTNNMSDDKAKLIVGKAVKENPYLDKDPKEGLREEFKKVLSEISINGNNGETKRKVEALDNTVENLVRMLGEKDRQIQDLKQTIDDKFEQLRKEFFAEKMKVKEP
jgi:predicted RNase H-like nuclease (RuvC/YqgF family)